MVAMVGMNDRVGVGELVALQAFQYDGAYIHDRIGMESGR